MITDKQYNLLVNHLDAPFEEKCSVSEALQYIRDNKGIVCWVLFDYIDADGYYGAFFDRLNILGLKSTDHKKEYPLAESALLTAILDYLIERKA